MLEFLLACCAYMMFGFPTHICDLSVMHIFFLLCFYVLHGFSDVIFLQKYMYVCICGFYFIFFEVSVIRSVFPDFYASCFFHALTYMCSRMLCHVVHFKYLWPRSFFGHFDNVTRLKHMYYDDSTLLSHITSSQYLCHRLLRFACVYRLVYLSIVIPGLHVFLPCFSGYPSSKGGVTA